MKELFSIHCNAAEHIYNATKIIKNFLHSSNVTEDAFYQMVHSVEIEGLFMPEKIEYMFYDYIERSLEPLIFEENLQSKDFFTCIFDAELELNEMVDKQIKSLFVY